MEKLNIAEILKDCPSGMELDCTMYDNVQFNTVQGGNAYPIKINTPEGGISLSKYGCYSLNPQCKCIIFPKGKTTWEGFRRPFKDGDVVMTESGVQVFIFKENAEYKGGYYTGMCYIGYDFECEKIFKKEGVWMFTQFATEEEKQKLFDAIKANDYKWNPETKTLEKLPKFKVGDRIVKRNSISNSWIVSSVSSEYYGLKLPEGSEEIGVICVSEQDNYELVPNKFDITTLKPFDKVLVRDTNGQAWTVNFFSHVIATNPKLPITFVCVSGCPNQCIPYEGNEHLRGKTYTCSDYFKTWE